MEEKIQTLIASGYVEIATDSGTGSRVLVNVASHRVTKINQDEAYAKFADFCVSNPQYAVPRIYSHTYPLGLFVALTNDAYSIAEMELLEPLTEAEQTDVVAWVQSIFATLKVGKSLSEYPDDPFDLKNTFQALLFEARRVGVDLDVLKKTNYLKRTSEGAECIVFSDPFN